MEREDFNIQTPEELIKYIESWLPKTGFGYYANFFIGITDDVERSLLDDHRIDPDNDIWLYSESQTKADAEQVLNHFLAKGMQGAKSAATPTTATTIYCYVITDTTKQ